MSSSEEKQGCHWGVIIGMILSYVLIMLFRC